MFFENVILLEDALTKQCLPALETFPCPYDQENAKSGCNPDCFPGIYLRMP